MKSVFRVRDELNSQKTCTKLTRLIYNSGKRGCIVGSFLAPHGLKNFTPVQQKCFYLTWAFSVSGQFDGLKLTA